MRTLPALLLFVATEFMAGPVVAANIGYYDMSGGQGNPNQEPPILIAGETPVLLTDLTAADLLGIDVLFVQNPSNSSYGFE